MNWYGYANSNPVGFIDPTGLFAFGQSFFSNPNAYFNQFQTGISTVLATPSSSSSNSKTTSSNAVASSSVATKATSVAMVIIIDDSPNTGGYVAPRIVSPIEVLKPSEQLTDMIIDGASRTIDGVLNTPVVGRGAFRGVDGFDGFSTNDIINFYGAYREYAFYAAESAWEDLVDFGIDAYHGAQDLIINARAGSGISEHENNARPSTLEKHQAGQKRKLTDTFGGEKGDKRRTPRKDPKKR